MKFLTRKRWIAVVLLFSVLPVWALESPQQMIEQTAKRVMDEIKANKAVYEKEPQRTYDLVDKIVLPHFDFERMAKLALGKYWRDTTADQRSRFIIEFRNMLVRTYASSLSEYTDREISYAPDAYSPGMEELTVKSDVEEPGGFPIPVNYRVYLHDDQWLVYDVTIDGVSLVTNYRASFASEIRKNGMDALIAKLAERSGR